MIKVNIGLFKAAKEDGQEIVEMLTRIYEDDIKRWNKTEIEAFLPGYNSVEMQKFYMENREYYKIVHEDNIAGIVVVDYNGGYHARLDKIYIDIGYQDKKIGTKVMNLVEELFPEVEEWTLDTSKKSLRNHHFYEKLGYVKVYESEDEIFYKKIIRRNNIADKNENKDLSKLKYKGCNLRETDYYSTIFYKSTFMNVNMSEINITNAALENIKITNANMQGSLIGDSKLDKIEVCHVSLGGAYFHDTNLGWFNENEKITIERCDLQESEILGCNLKNVNIKNCDISGMKINEISVEEMMDFYRKHNSNQGEQADE